MQAILSIFETKRPISQEIIGYRAKLAVPNQAGNAFGKTVPSFKKPYLIAESGDFGDMNDLGLERWIKRECSLRGLELVG